MRKKVFLFLTLMMIIVSMSSCKKTIKITLCPNNGNPNFSVNASKGEEVDSLVTLSHYGYFFVGWFYDSSFKNLVTFPTTFDKDTTLYGGWHTYVTYELDEVTDTYSVNSVVLPLTKIEVLATYKDKQVTTIKENVFKGNESIVQVVLPETITTIENNAFSNMTKLEDINLPDSVINMGDNLFEGSDNIIYDNTSGVKYIDNWLVDATECETQTVNVKDTTIGIFKYAFFDNQVVEKINIPSSVKFIGDYAFSYANSILEINVDENNTVYSSLNGVLYNKDKTLLIKYPSSRVNVEITLPASVEQIKTRAFENCSNLKVINIPKKVSYIKANTFSNCRVLTTINYENKNVIIESDAYNNCPELNKVDYQNLSYVAFGDSITYGVDGVNGGIMEKPYPTLVGETLSLKSYENKGISGATFCSNTVNRTNMTEKILSYKQHADIVSVMLGVNDFLASLPLGTPTDKTNSTIYGSIYLICEHFKAYYKNSFVFFMTPFPYKKGTTKNSEGYLLEDVVEAIKYMAEKYDYPVLDMFNNSGYENEMCQSKSDGLHPSQSFMENYAAPLIVSFIKNYYTL